jgi:transcriptional antiterminator NusG
MTVIYALRTTVGREEAVLDKLSTVVQKKGYGIVAALMPKEVRGYILIEANDLSAVEDAIKGINHVRGLVRDAVLLKDIQHFLVAKSTKIKLDKGDIVELISGPFKGEKARISRIDKTKSEVIVELIEAAVPIPITVAIESVRLLISHTPKAEEVAVEVATAASASAQHGETKEEETAPATTSASKKVAEGEMLF